ncbi:MAG TPA: hypothetical protein VLH75_07305 [Longimicrobiales bacterium]|nr:hypothetical protein [Longimicrobiales bacterium]
MAKKTGSLTIADLLAARFQSVAEYGEDTVQDVLAADIAAHNLITTQMLTELCEITTDRQALSGSSLSGEMVEVDEHGRAPTQRDRPGSTVGFPLKLYQFNVGWTRKWLEGATPADLAIKTQGAEKAHLRRIQTDIKKAVYESANYTHRDHLVDDVDLAVKRFLNADSAPIPDGPNGETFTASTHTHYDANATLTAAVLTAIIDDVVEHGHGDRVRLNINRSNEAAVRALTGFTAYVDPRLTLQADANEPTVRATINRLDNRPIGLFGAAEVWVKPWAIADYYFAHALGGPKPLAFRQRTQAALQGLRMVSQSDIHPLVVDFMEAEFGLGVRTRTNGAVLYVGGASYVDPTI